MTKYQSGGEQGDRENLKEIKLGLVLDYFFFVAQPSGERKEKNPFRRNMRTHYYTKK